MSDPIPQGRPSSRYAAERGGIGRLGEDVGMWLALGLGTLRGISELAHEWIAMFVPLRPHTHGIPWAFLGIFFGCLIPKTLGVVTAGEIWKSIGSGLGRLISRGRPAGPGEPDA